MKHLRKKNGAIVIKNNRQMIGKGSLMKLQRQEKQHMTGASVSYHTAAPIHHQSTEAIHYDTNLERLRKSLANINLSTTGKKYVKF
jgi:hypothetical protein